MIRINLLPGADKKGKAKGRGPAPAKAGGGGGGGAGGMVIVLVAAAFFSAAGGIAYFSYGKVLDANGRVKAKQAERDKVQRQIDEMSEDAKKVQSLMEMFNNQLEVLKALDPPNRILWSEKLNMIAKLMPADVFLTEIEIKELVTQVVIKSSEEAMKKWESQATDKRGPKPEALKKPVLTYTVKLTALTTGKDSTEQLNNVDRFYNALQEYGAKDNHGTQRKFMDNIADISFNGFNTMVYENQYAVGQFSFLITTKALQADEDEKKEDASAKAPAKAAAPAPAKPPARRP